MTAAKSFSNWRTYAPAGRSTPFSDVPGKTAAASASAAVVLLTSRGENRHGLRGTEPSATEAQRHEENLRILGVSVSLWRILRVSQPGGRFLPHGLLS